MLVGGCLKAKQRLLVQPGADAREGRAAEPSQGEQEQISEELTGLFTLDLNQVHLKPPITGLLKVPAGSFISFGEVQAGLQLL